MFTPFFLNGTKKSGTLAEPLRAPFNGEILAQVAQATPADIESAITGMVQSRTPLERLPSYKRAEACAHIHRRLTERTEEFAKTLALEAGKPIRAARIEVQRAITTFKLASEEATRITGEQLPVDINPRAEGFWAIVQHVPIGPCSFLTPFNFPMNPFECTRSPPPSPPAAPSSSNLRAAPLTALLLGELKPKPISPQVPGASSPATATPPAPSSPTTASTS